MRPSQRVPVPRSTCSVTCTVLLVCHSSASMPLAATIQSSSPFRRRLRSHSGQLLQHCRSRVTLNASDNGQAHSQTHLRRISRSRPSFCAEASSARQGHRKGGLLSCISQSVALQANCQDAFVHSAQIVRLSTCSQLIRLDLSQNDLTSLEGVSQNTTLKWLSAQSNQIASLTGTASLVQLQVYLHRVLLAVQLVIVCCVYSKAYCKQQINMVKNQAVLLQA